MAKVVTVKKDINVIMKEWEDLTQDQRYNHLKYMNDLFVAGKTESIKDARALAMHYKPSECGMYTKDVTVYDADIAKFICEVKELGNLIYFFRDPYTRGFFGVDAEYVKQQYRDFGYCFAHEPFNGNKLYIEKV